VSDDTTRTYRDSQPEALYREIFALQTGARWQDEQDFTAWYESRGWSYHRPRVTPEMFGLLACGGKSLHAISEAKVEKLREEMRSVHGTIGHPTPSRSWRTAR
jgi:hypothetical protein